MRGSAIATSLLALALAAAPAVAAETPAAAAPPAEAPAPAAVAEPAPAAAAPAAPVAANAARPPAAPPAIVASLHLQRADSTLTALRGYLPFPINPQDVLKDLVGDFNKLVLLSAPMDLVVALDPAWRQVSVGQERGSAAWVQGSATSLPIADASVDAAVVCLVFEHVAALDDALAEVARVVRPGGTFLFLLNHPLLQTPGSGWIDDQIIEEQYWRIGPYLIEDETIEEVEKNVFIPFIHRPLSRYVNALAGNGLLLQQMVEPAPPPGFLARAEEYEAASTIPRLLYLRTRKVTGV